MSPTYRLIPAFAAALTLVSVTIVEAQVPHALQGRLLFTLGGADAGEETYQLQRLAAGGYRLSGDVDLRIPGMHIVQRVEAEADDRLAFRTAHVRASVNQDTTEVTLRREGGQGVQSVSRGGSTVTSGVDTPAGSVLLTNNVIHHIAQFAWLHQGPVSESQEFVAFPRVPITVVLEAVDTARREGAALPFRRYYLNLANRLGAYVWLAADGTPLKVAVPLQAFEAVSAEHRGWSEQLQVGRAESKPEEPADAYTAEEVSFGSDTITLAGTLTLPKGAGPWPAAVLITGSGAQDRDENTPGPGGLKLGIFRSIADALTRSGIAVLRYDDRGVGGSGGDLNTAGLSDLVADVHAAVGYLRGRHEIDAARIALVGHSEGAIIAPIVADADHQLAAVVLMAGTATPLDSVLVEQFEANARDTGGDSAAVAQAGESARQLSRAIRAGGEVEAELPPQFKALASNVKWMREHFEHDPLATVRRLRAPVLIVNGEQDVQVVPEHARRLDRALTEAGHPDHELRIFPRLNHLFAVSKGEGTAEYADPNAKADAEFLSYLADWLSVRLAKR